MKTLHGAAILWVALFVGPPAPSTPILQDEVVEVTDDSAFEFGEMSFTYPGDEEDDVEGRFFVDNQRMSDDGFSTGFVHVIQYLSDDDEEGAWVVQNVPIVSPSVSPGSAIYFQFADATPRAKQPRGQMQAKVVHTNVAVKKKPKPKNKAPAIVRNLNPTSSNARGIAIADKCIPKPTGSVTPAFDPKNQPDTDNHVPGPERDSVEQDVNQCCPGAVSNSMEYLKQEQGVAVDAVLGTNNGPGIAGAPATSRVAQLDSFMGRAQGKALFPREVIDGKLKFVKAAGIDNAIDVKHWGKVCDRQGNSEEGNITVNGVTSTRSKLSCADFIKQEIDDGEDVELLVVWKGPSGQLQGHCVQVTGYDIAKGELKVRIVEDANQGFNPFTGTTAINGGVGPGVGGGHGLYHLRKQGGFLRVQNFHNAVVVNVISESKT